MEKSNTLFEWHRINGRYRDVYHGVGKGGKEGKGVVFPFSLYMRAYMLSSPTLFSF
jgi:hypothetical protein